MGKLTTHVLDTAKGTPAQGIRIDVFAGDALPPHCHHQLPTGASMAPSSKAKLSRSGSMNCAFTPATICARTTPDLKEPLFLDVIPICFGIADASQHYHVPLLLSPFSFSTYRGS